MCFGIFESTHRSTKRTKRPIQKGLQTVEKPGCRGRPPGRPAGKCCEFAERFKIKQHVTAGTSRTPSPTVSTSDFFDTLQSERIVVGEDGFAFLRKSHGRANSPPDCLLGPAFRIRPPTIQTHKKTNPKRIGLFVVGEDGFEPSKRNAADLQSVPFGHSGTPPYEVRSILSEWSR